MKPYAATTTVPVMRSEQEIETLLRRYGATETAVARGEGRSLFGFKTKRALVNITLPLPTKSQMSSDTKWEQECRRRHRALVLVLKAKLEAIHSGITTFEAGFLSDVVMPNGKTLGSEYIPQLESLAQGGKLPPLLPAC